MGTEIRGFRDLDAWKQAHALAVNVYTLTNKFPKSEQFGITSQLQRASSSVGANIAEGFGRFHFNDKTHFYHQARGSATEVENFLLLAVDLGYTDSKIAERVISDCLQVQLLINGLIRSIQKQKSK